MNDQTLFKQMCEDLEKLVGIKMESPTDFEKLSECIYNKTKESISTTTLKRFFGHTNESVTPHASTLSILARALGYLGWSEYIQQGCPESGFVTSQSITTAELSLGDQIHFEWSPDRKCTVQYLGDNRFKVISVENAKLQLGDSFSVMAFALGQPLYVSKLQRANKEGILQDYVAGYKTGLTKIYLNQKEKTSD